MSRYFIGLTVGMAIALGLSAVYSAVTHDIGWAVFLAVLALWNVWSAVDQIRTLRNESSKQSDEGK